MFQARLREENAREGSYSEETIHQFPRSFPPRLEQARGLNSDPAAEDVKNRLPSRLGETSRIAMRTAAICSKSARGRRSRCGRVGSSTTRV